MAVDIRWNQVETQLFLETISEGLAGELAREVADRARPLAPVRSGRMKASVDSGTERDSSGVFGWAGSIWYGRFMDPKAQQLHYRRPFLPSALYATISGHIYHL
jgi:hypothetical protein